MAPRARASLGLALVLGGCPLTADIAGKPCASDADCGDVHYCQLEIEPHVCIPGSLGLPALPNHPPLIERAVVVVPLASAGRADLVRPPTVTGAFGVRDPDGDADAPLVWDATPQEGALGTLVVAGDGSYTFTAAGDMPLLDAIERYPVAVADARGSVGRAEAVVVVVAQLPGEGMQYWAGVAGGAPASFGDAGNWDPAGVPDADDSVVVGPGAAGPLALDADSAQSVSGWTHTGAVAVELAPGALLTVQGARVLSAAPLSPAGTFALAPAGGIPVEVQLLGELPSARIQSDLRVAAPSHASGTVELAAGLSVKLDANFVVDGDLTQGPGGAALSLDGGALYVAGSLTLEGAAPSVLARSLVDVGGDLVIANDSVFLDGLSVRLGLAPAADGAAPQRVSVRTRDATRFLDGFIPKGARVSFDSDVAFDGALTLAGAVGVTAGNVVDVETLVIRPSFVELPEGSAGSLDARVCLLPPRVALPSWINCQQDLGSPPPRPEVPRPDPGPDPGPARQCSSPQLELPSDQVRHGLVVAVAGADPVNDTLETIATGFAPTQVPLRGGQLALAADGSYTFTPSAVAGDEGADVLTQVAVDAPTDPLLDLEACVDVHVVDTEGMNAMLGRNWDDPASWSLGQVPTATDRVLIPPSAGARLAKPGGPPLVMRELVVSSGAVLDAGGRDVIVTEAVFSGGNVVNGAVRVGAGGAAAVVAGRLEALHCDGGAQRLASALVVDRLSGDCALTLLTKRLTVRSSVESDVLALVMEDTRSVFAVDGDAAIGRLDGALNEGELVLAGAVAIGEWAAFSLPAHRTLLRFPQTLNLADVAYEGWLTVGGAEDGDGDGDGDFAVLFSGASVIDRLTAHRAVELAPGATLFVDELDVTTQFSTAAAPPAFVAGSCLGLRNDPDAAAVCP